MKAHGLIGRLLCRHEWVWVRNVHGDEVFLTGGKRSWWRCRKCGKFKLRPELYYERE